MVLIIKKGASEESIKKIVAKLKNRKSKKGFPSHKYCGILKIKEDALDIQKRLRDEWK